MGSEPVIRFAVAEDLPAIVALKLPMIEEAGLADFFASDIAEQVLSCYDALYAAGTARHFIVEQESEIIACAGAFLKDDLPFCFHRTPIYGFIGDVYTGLAHRRQGHARHLTLTAIRWLKDHGTVTIRLLATPEARPLYEALGFQPSGELVLRL